MHNTIESNLNAEGLKFAIIVSRFNDFITSRLLDGAMDCLKRHGANIDDTQVVSKKFDAVCTPDFFGYNRDRELQYRGRLFEMKNLEIVDREKNHLLDAMQLIVKTGVGPKKQIPSSGCSIKWK